MKTTTSHQFAANAALNSSMHLYTMSMGIIKGMKAEKQMPSRFGIIKQRIGSSQSEPAAS